MKPYFKRLLSLAMTALVVLTGVGGLVTPMTAQAAGPFSHTRATAADFVTPNAYNMKGLQGSEVTHGPFKQDPQALNLNHILFNVDLADIISTTGTGTPYTYNGKTYYFNEAAGSMMQVLLARVKEYRTKGIVTTFCIVLSDKCKSPVHRNLMYNYQPDKVYYALNVFNAEAQNQIAATLHYMANRFGYSDTFVQNWRIGNEVNVSHNSNFSGAAGSNLTQTIVDLAVTSYNLMHTALNDENPYARVYTSVTHDWTSDNEGTSVPTKTFIDKFAAKVSDPNWNIDFHAYPPQMHEQVWTKASATYLTHDVNSFSVCGANLEVLTNYIKNNYGTNHRIALSEQSYDSRFGQAEQAAMIAYTYYAAVNSGMVDNVIFTTFADTGSVYHDFYDMGVLDINGNPKESYNVFRYMNSQNSAEVNTYVNPYLSKLSAWTGRNITSWTDDILYQPAATSTTLSSASLYYPEDQQGSNYVYIGMSSSPACTELDLEYKWTAFNYTTKETIQLTGWVLNNNWLKWYPTENATYNISCTVRVAGNTSSSITDAKNIPVNIAGNPTSTEGEGDTTTIGVFANYEGFNFNRDAAGNITCTNAATGEMVFNGFMCDGTYTYYFQLDGTAMKNRLTYHPDGEHIIYFNQYAHEVFDNFAMVKQSIEGNPVDDMCYFNTFGYMYVDFLTYDTTGVNLYYANPYGVMERNGWFRFSDNGLGYANPNGVLMANTFTFDPLGRTVYLQGNGHAAVGLISDGVYFYEMDANDGHLIGMFPV